MSRSQIIGNISMNATTSFLYKYFFQISEESPDPLDIPPQK